MDKKKLLLLIGALTVAIGTALAARSLFAGAATPPVAAAPPPAPVGPKVLVAQRALPVGTIVTADAVSFQEWPKNLIQDAYFVDGQADMTKLLGTVVRNPISAGQPMTRGTLVAPGDRGFLAAALGPGMRAVTITVSQKTAVAGFVFPGDRVDMLLTQTVEATAAKVAETVLRNLRVLATDQQTASETVDGRTVVRAFATVTLEVTPKQAEKIAVAENLGTISLVLRSIADNQSQLDSAIASGSVKLSDGASKGEEERLLGRAMRNPADGSTTFASGGDVSRFQKRVTVPAPGPASGGTRAPSGPGSAPVSPGDSGGVLRVVRGSAMTEVPVGGTR